MAMNGDEDEMTMFRSMLRVSGVFYPYVYLEVLFLFFFYRLRVLGSLIFIGSDKTYMKQL